MLREIWEQPEVVFGNIVSHLNEDTDEVVFGEFDGKRDELEQIRRITFLGCGTSYHASLYGNYIFEELAGLPCDFELADEFNWRKTVIEEGTAFIVVSQSGQTAEAIAAVKKVKTKKSFVIAVTNTEDSSLSRLADVTILNKAGRERAVAATKTFTSSLILLLLFSLYLRQIAKRRTGRRSTAAYPHSEIMKEIKLLPAKIAAVLSEEEAIAGMIQEYARSNAFIVLGEKYGFPIALEIALKLKETSYVQAEGIAAGEFRHGPMALVHDGLPVIYICPEDVHGKSLEFVKEIRREGGDILIISDSSASSLKNIASHMIVVPKTDTILSPFLTVIPGQIMAYYLSVISGNDPDKPRHLRKFVD